MPLTVEINGTDRTRLIPPESLRITNMLTSQVDRCRFLIRKFGDRTFAPAVRDEVVIELDGTKLFAGHIWELNENYGKIDDISYEVICVDYTKSLDARLVVDSFENQTVDQIVAYIRENYLPGGITTNNVDCPTEIKYVSFNYEYPSDCFRQLAEAV